MSTSPTRVLILAGGLSHERDVSLRSGRRVGAALQEAGFDVHVRDIDAALLATIQELQPDIVWPLVHGAAGEDGSLQDLLELLNVPYIGTAADGCRLASRKSVAKSVLRAHDIPTPHAAVVPQTLVRQLGPAGILAAIQDSLGLPLIIKPDDGGSALGVTIVRDAAALPGAMVACYAYSRDALLEQLVEGIEVAISVVDTGHGPKALPPVEIVTDGPYDYDARYNAGQTEFFTPARLSDDDADRARQCAVRVHEVLGLRHLSRTDLIIDKQGTPWVLDVNVAPGMTETSLFPQAAAEGPGQSVYADIVRAALTQGSDPSLPRP